MGKIIEFPTKLTEPVQQYTDGKYMEEVNKAQIEQLVDLYGHDLAIKFEQHGYDIDDDKFIERYMFSLEIIKAVLYNNLGYGHRLIGMIDKQSQRYFSKVNKSND
jgi:hypothetical protein